jgi:hypothetical protein
VAALRKRRTPSCSAARYTLAKYGEFRVDRGSGEAVLVGLRGAGLEPL